MGLGGRTDLSPKLSLDRLCYEDLGRVNSEKSGLGGTLLPPPCLFLQVDKPLPLSVFRFIRPRL